VSEDIARRAGEFARSHRRSHCGIGVVDYLLAAPYPPWALIW